MNLPSIHTNYERILEAIESDDTYDGETLFINGGKSDYISPSDMPNIQKFFPQATLTTIPQAGHWVHAEAPNEFFEIIRTAIK